MVTIPRALERGDTVAFISPSSRLNDVFPSRIQQAQKYLEEQLGFNVKIIFNPSPADTIRASALQRCAEIHNAFSDSSIKAIICTIGGQFANELLPYLDYTLIAANPKIFVGYSDITLLHYALFTKAHLRTFYGPAVIPCWGEYPAPMTFTVDRFLHVVQKSCASTPVGPLPRSEEWTDEFLDWFAPPEALRPRTMLPSRPWKWLSPGKAQGRVFGGCLPSVLQLKGTPYDVDYRGRILLLELCEAEAGPDIPIPIASVRAMMGDLVLAGVLDVIVGLVIGRPYQHTDEMRKEWEKVVLDVCEGRGFPIVVDVDVGHTHPMLTIPLDAMVRIDSGRNEIVVEEAAVE